MKKEHAVIRKRFTLVLPKSIREQLGIREEDPVSISIEEGKIVIELLKDDPFARLSKLGKDVEFTRSARKQAHELLERLT